MEEQYDILDTNLRRLSHAEFNMLLLNIADALDAHSFFKDNWEPYVPGSQHFRAHASDLKEVGLGADRGDRGLKEERDTKRALAQLHIDVAAKYMVVRSVEKNDPSLLHNTGIPLKAKPSRNSNRGGSAASVPINLNARRGKGTGSAVLEGKHVRNGGPYLLHICKGEPVSEESWYSPGGHYRACTKIVLQNLEPANRYYFRIRTDGPDGQGPWSQAVSLIIT